MSEVGLSLQAQLSNRFKKRLYKKPKLTCAINVDFLTVFAHLIKTHIDLKCHPYVQIRSKNKRVRAQFRNSMLTCTREITASKKNKEKIRNKRSRMKQSFKNVEVLNFSLFNKTKIALTIRS